MAAFVNIPKVQTLSYEACLKKALQKANSTAHRVLLRLYKPIENTEVWPSPAVSFPPGDLRIAWADGRRQEAFWAVGKVAEIRCGHIIRFAQAQNGCSDFCEQSVEVSMEAGFSPNWSSVPVGIGGFAFTPTQRMPSEVWSGWEDGVLWVPRILFHSSGGQSGACLTLAVEPGANLKALRQVLVENLAELEAELSRLALRELPAPAGAERTTQIPTKTATNDEIASAKSAWYRRVETARSAIRNGELDKVVLARRVEWEAPPHSEFDAFRTAHRLRQEYPTCKVFLIQRSDGSAFVGATPEILVALEGEQIEAVSLAGTARRGLTPAEDTALGEALVASSKDQHEHRLVTEAIRTSFEPIVEDLEIDDEPHLLKLQNVQHLETPIRAKLDRTRGIMELVSRLHPTPAVGGTPALEAQKWLHDNENLERGWYAGLVGWVTSGGDGVFAVAIRSALIRPKKAWSFAGAGLVADSDPYLEWEETALKLEAMGKSLVVQAKPSLKSVLSAVTASEEVEIHD